MLHRGWKPLEDTPNEVGFYCPDMPKTSVRRLWIPDSPSRIVNPQPRLVLQAAEYWHVPVEILVHVQDDFIPPLATLADSLITAFMVTPDNIFLYKDLELYVWALYSEIEGTREPGFAEKRGAINRRFREDALGGMMVTGIPTLVQHRVARDMMMKEMKGKGAC